MIQLVKNNNLINQLSEPTVEQLQQSELLIKEIVNNIQNNDNWLSFKDYMNLALYHPLYGYYTSGNRKIGPSGDFITAPELGSLFAYSLANQIKPILQIHKDFDILEFGAGSGQLAFDLLTSLDDSNNLPKNYYILDLSTELKNRQEQTLSKLPSHIQDKITWLNTLPEDNDFQGVILANEVIDAMPVNLFQFDDSKLKELGLSITDNKIIWQSIEPDFNLSNYVTENIEPLIKPNINQNNSQANNIEYYNSEINFLAKDWLQTISQILSQGLIMLIDYGFPRHEYYHTDRNQGTLMCHYKHHSHHDPLLYPGLQDITAHVDFTSLAETAMDNNLDVVSFTNQANFLLANNITSHIEQNKNDKNIFKLKQQLKTLTSPSEMGELFKVLLLSKHLNFDFFDHLQIFDKRSFL